MKRLIIECGVAETRAALLIDDVIWKFWFGSARGDEASDTFPRAGRRFAGRVKAVDNGLDAAFVDLGDGRDAFLALKKSNQDHCIDGALIEVEIKAPPRQSKGAALKFIGALKDGEPGRLPPFQDAAVEAAETIGGDADEFLIDDGAALRALQAAGFENARHEAHPVSLFEKHEADQEFEAAFERAVPLSGGGRLIIDEAHALTAIDVDTGGLTASSPARLREKIAFAAAEESMRQVSLRNIGGHIVIDFPDIPSDAGRRRFQAHLKKTLARLDGAGAASFSRSNLYSLTAPHHALSLLDRFTEKADAEPIAGRRFTRDAAAKMAVAALERRLRAEPSKRFRLTAGADIRDRLSKNEKWLDRLTQRHGPRFDIFHDSQLGDRLFDLAQQ
ncbi:ribonuclease E/G [Hyphococcus sp.]|uniref:ribonuclease E/G n=1 Tax=Hyphococcus sp. TaxID=2038636 RepID=UPI003D0A3348